MPSYCDYSDILSLMDVKRLYEEQEEKWKARLAEREDQVQNVRHDLEWRRRQVEDLAGAAALDEEIARLEAEKVALTQEAQQKIAQLQQRLAELSRRLGQK